MAFTPQTRLTVAVYFVGFALHGCRVGAKGGVFAGEHGKPPGGVEHGAEVDHEAPTVVDVELHAVYVDESKVVAAVAVGAEESA